MQLKKQQKYICVLLILTMLLSGICSPHSASDSFFSDACQQNTTSITDILSHAFSVLKACTNEMLGHRETVDLVRRTGRPSERTGTGALSCPSFMETLLQALLPMSDSLPDCLSCSTNFHMVIIRYVHHQDGKKG